jgi:hypothetical protein
MLTNKDIEKIMKIVQDCKIEMTDTLFGTRPEHIKTFAEGFMRCRNKIAAELICLQDTLNKKCNTEQNINRRIRFFCTNT